MWRSVEAVMQYKGRRWRWSRPADVDADALISMGDLDCSDVKHRYASRSFLYLPILLMEL